MKMISKNIEDFLSFLRTCDQEYHIAVSEETEQNNITQDLLHSIELEEHSYREFASLAKEIQSNRKKRREAKDTIQIITPVIDWIESNRQTIKNMEELLGKVRKAERSTENRIYTPRVNKK